MNEKMCSLKIKSFINNPYFLILIIYCFCHFFMLFLTGSFWDDITYETHDSERFFNIAMMTGRPEWFYLLRFAWSFPHNTYRFLVFLMYGFQAIMFYRILLVTQAFGEKDSLWISLIYITVPVNDARLLLSDFSYCVGLTFFILAVYCYICYKNTSAKKDSRFIKRIGIQILFLFSFCLNSLLFFYYLIFLYDFIKKNNIIIRNNSFSYKNFFLVIFDVIILNIDFILLPFCFFIAKSILFPVYGIYAGYNTLSMNCIINAALKSFLLIPHISLETLYNYRRLFSPIILFSMVVLLLIVFGSFDDILEKKKTQGIHPSKMIVLSIFMIYMAIFPYVAVGRYNINTSGISGRDSILIPVGIAFLIYSVLTQVLFKRIRNVFFVLFVLLGVAHFNWWYLEYQTDYYYQLAFERKVDLAYIREHQNFIVINNNPTMICGDRFYTWSNIARRAFGSENHFFMNGIHDLKYLNSDFLSKRSPVLLDGIREINPQYINLDGIISFESRISKKKALKLKIKELFFKDKFQINISRIGVLKVISLDFNKSNTIMSAYTNRRIRTNQELLNMATHN